MAENDWLSEQLQGLNAIRESSSYAAVGDLPKPNIVVPNIQKFQELPVEEPEIQIDPMLSVDQMIEQINCYRLLLNDSLFAGTLSPIAQTVENEIREFIVERIQVLLGKKAPKIDAQFTESEVKMLKDVANALLKKQNTTKVSTVASPVLNKPAIKQQPPAPLKLNKVEGPKVEQTIVPQFTQVVPQEVPAVTISHSSPIVETAKKGRPKGAKKVISPKAIVDKNTGEIKHPVIEIKGQVRPEGQQPMRMPAPNTVMPHVGELMNTSGTGSNY